MIKDVGPDDLALIELAAGGTSAPAAVLARLRARGYVITTAGRPTLTAEGRQRAERVRPGEHDLRLMYGAGKGGAPLTTDAGPSFHS